MYRILTASKDTYITNKIIENSFRATDGNVGQAGTLDLFKLYDESTLSGSTTPIELSRVLIKFDLDPLRAMTGSTLDITNSTFRCFMHLSDVYGGQGTPTNFKLILFPLSKSFDEGFGRDLSQFMDLDTANFITASGVSGIVPWEVTGANKQGLLGSSDIDIISSGSVGSGVENLWVEQTFSSGEEDLIVDVTKIVSATLTNQIPDHGFRLSFSGTQETDNRTRYVKRFISRHSTNTRKAPKIRVTFNDAIQDDHENFFFNITGSLFLNNTHRGTPANLLSGSSATPITGANSLLVRLVSGSYSSSITASQHTIAGNTVTGLYSASFAVSSEDSLLKTEIRTAGSATFSEIWTSLDETVPFLSSTLVIKTPNRTSFDNEPSRFTMSISNMRKIYHHDELVRMRLHVQEVSTENDFKAFKTPNELTSAILRDAYYRIRDANSNDVIIPFETSRKSTLLSTDSKGMFFDVYMDSFDIGRVYEIDILVKNQGVDQTYNNVGGRFRVEP